LEVLPPEVPMFRTRAQLREMGELSDDDD